MSKQNPFKNLKNHQELPFDFSDFEDSSLEDEMVSGMMSGLLQTASQHIHAAVALTKIAVDKNPSHSLTDTDVFATFKKASQAIHDVFPIKKIWDDFS